MAAVMRDMFGLASPQNRAESCKLGRNEGTSGEESQLVEAEEIPRCLFVGPKGSGKTSLLFQYGLSLVGQGRRVTFISHETLHTMPLQVSGVSQPDQLSLKQLHIMYLNSQDALLKYLCSVHTQNALPTAILVDNLDYYVRTAQTAEAAPVIAMLCAHLVDAAHFISNKLSEGKSANGRVLCPVVATVTPPGDRTALQWYRRFLTAVWEVKGVAGQPHIYQLSDVSGGRRDSLVVTYETGRKLQVLDLQEAQVELGEALEGD